MWLERDLVMLPSNEKAMIHLTESNILIKSIELTGKSDLYKSNPQHLYILSDEKPQEGDKIIIASTDNLLIRDNWLHPEMKEYVCQIPQSFIEEFVEEYNKGSFGTDEIVTLKVMVEYEKSTITINKTFPASVKQNYELKINPKDNTINIKLSEQKTYTREQVVEVVKKAVYKKQNAWKIGELDKWLEENL